MKQHPLINRVDSKHYDAKGKPAICDFEREYTIGELMAWAKITKAKYDHPARATKGQVEADLRKAKTYGDYYDMLLGIVSRAPHLRDVSAERAYTIVKYDFIY